jgi:hypothetical protein
MINPIGPAHPPHEPPKDPALVQFGKKLEETKGKLQDPDFDPSQLEAWLAALMGEGEGLPAWANSPAAEEFRATLNDPNIDHEFLVQVIDTWLQQQGINPNTNSQKQS